MTHALRGVVCEIISLGALLIGVCLFRTLIERIVLSSVGPA